MNTIKISGTDRSRRDRQQQKGFSFIAHSKCRNILWFTATDMNNNKIAGKYTGYFKPAAQFK
nr:hypothetical protein SUGSMm_13450 [Morganella morganii subsp. sibonii]